MPYLRSEISASLTPCSTRTYCGGLLSSPPAAWGWPAAISAFHPMWDLAAPGQSHLTCCDLGFEHFASMTKLKLKLCPLWTSFTSVWGNSMGTTMGWPDVVDAVGPRETFPSPGVLHTVLSSLLSMSPCLVGPGTSTQTHVPQVTDMLQMITTLCSLKTTAEGSQLQQISRRCMQQSWASYWRALCRGWAPQRPAWMAQVHEVTGMTIFHKSLWKMH